MDSESPDPLLEGTLPAEDHALFRLGQHVEAKWPGGRKWYTCNIEAVGKNGSYTILYPDGSAQKNILEKEIRMPEKTGRRWAVHEDHEAEQAVAAKKHGVKEQGIPVFMTANWQNWGATQCKSFIKPNVNAEMMYMKSSIWRDVSGLLGCSAIFLSAEECIFEKHVCDPPVGWLIRWHSTGVWSLDSILQHGLANSAADETCEAGVYTGKSPEKCEIYLRWAWDEGLMYAVELKVACNDDAKKKCRRTGQKLHSREGVRVLSYRVLVRQCMKIKEGSWWCVYNKRLLTSCSTGQWQRKRFAIEDKRDEASSAQMGMDKVLSSALCGMEVMIVQGVSSSAQSCKNELLSSARSSTEGRKAASSAQNGKNEMLSFAEIGMKGGNEDPTFAAEESSLEDGEVKEEELCVAKETEVTEERGVKETGDSTSCDRGRSRSRVPLQWRKLGRNNERCFDHQADRPCSRNRSRSTVRRRALHRSRMSFYERARTQGYSEQADACSASQPSRRRRPTSLVPARASTAIRRRPCTLHADDRRFEIVRRQRLYVCDGCGSRNWFNTRAVPFRGQYVRRDWPEFTTLSELERLYYEGQADVTWLCEDCGGKVHRDPHAW